MKVLLLDIESSPNTAYVWGLWKENIPIDRLIESSFLLCWAAKWYGEDKIQFSDYLQGTEHMLSRIHNLLDEADGVVHFNGCLVPGTNILKHDNTWVDVASLKEGDILLGFNEKLPNKNQKRKFEFSTVEKIVPFEAECSEVLLSDGTKITCTNNHPWLVKANNASNYKYVETSNLTDEKFIRLFDTWKQTDDFDLGYISGFLDADGCVSSIKRVGREPEQYTFNITFSQNKNEHLERLKKLLCKYNFKYSETQYDPSNRKCVCLRILGGFSEYLRFFGIVRSNKIFSKETVEFRRIYSKEDINIVSVTPVGKKLVIGLQTSSRTYIAEGFPCHNSRFDIPVLNKEFLLHGFNPPSPHKEIDLYKVAKNKFRFPSNKLDYIAQRLGVGKKVKHAGMSLWIRCMEGDKEAMKQMQVYNEGDVRILEGVYKKMLPWIGNHVNMSLKQEQVVCPRCNSHKINKRGFHYTSAMKYQRLQCQDCGGWFRTGGNVGPKPDAKGVIIT